MSEIPNSRKQKDSPEVRFGHNTLELIWQGFVCGNQTSTEEILINDTELSQIEDEIRQLRDLLEDQDG